MSEANELVDLDAGRVTLLDIQRNWVMNSFHQRAQFARDRGEYYSWTDFVREALTRHAEQVIGR